MRQFDGPVSVAELAAAIGPGLAKSTLAGEVDGHLVDASDRIEDDATGNSAGRRASASRDENPGAINAPDLKRLAVEALKRRGYQHTRRRPPAGLTVCL